MHVVPWVFFSLFYFPSTLVYNEFGFVPQVFTWAFDPNTNYGHFLHWNNTVFNGICASIEITFNLLSLATVHKMRKSIQNVATYENQRREVKLLIQCFILGLVFTMTDVLYTIVITMGWTTPAVLLCMQFTWTSNHCINPAVYLSLNTRLRGRFIRFVTCGRYGSKSQNAIAHAAPMTGSDVGGAKC